MNRTWTTEFHLNMCHVSEKKNSAVERTYTRTRQSHAHDNESRVLVQQGIVWHAGTEDVRNRIKKMYLHVFA